MVPLVLIPYLYINKKIPSWTIHIYILFFLICALGWEIWFNYGLVNGDNVSLRRAAILSTFLPININWFLNSLADSGTICLGGLYFALKIMKNDGVLQKWNWKFFFILLSIFITQNLFVEMFLYHDQLAIGKSISWAPLSPLGPNLNPILFTLADRTVSVQSQIPWLIMTPIFYGYLIFYINKK
tara:strand:+ start:397 stop:948 length:552 start_codon:yes stop_codon:yes gene_type:complete